MERKPFKKHLGEIPLEPAHNGNGKRQLILSKTDSVSEQLQAMTKGFLPVGGIFDWHKQEDMDEFFLVISGTGVIEFEDEMHFNYEKDDLIYIPSNVTHRMRATGSEENQFFFIRLNY